MATAFESSRWSAFVCSWSSLWRKWTVRWCKSLASSWQWVKISAASATNEANCLRQADSVWLLIHWRASSSSATCVKLGRPSDNRLRRTGVTWRNTKGIFLFKISIDTKHFLLLKRLIGPAVLVCDRPGRLYWNNWAIRTDKSMVVALLSFLLFFIIHSLDSLRLDGSHYEQGGSMAHWNIGNWKKKKDPKRSSWREMKKKRASGVF